MKKRMMTLCISALMLATVLTACSNANSSNESDSEQVEITRYIGSFSSDERVAHVREVIAEFEELNPDIKVNVSMVSDPAVVRQQLAAGGGPDIVGSDPTDMRLFAASGYLVPLNRYAEEYNWHDRFDGWALDTLRVEGELWGLPEELDAMIVYYNVSMFEEHGWSIPQSYEELISLSEEMTEKGIIPFSYGTSDFKPANQWWLATAFSASLGQEKFHTLLHGGLSWTSDEVRTAVEQLMNLWRNNYIFEDAPIITLDEARSLFIGQRAAMMMSGSWEVEDLMADEPEFEWGFYQMPAWNDGIEAVVPVAIGGSISINARCEHPDAVAKYLDYVFDREVIARTLELGSLYPMKDIDVSDRDVPEKMKELQEFLSTALASGNVGYCGWTYWPPNTDTYAWHNIEALLLNQISLDEYLRGLQENFELDIERDNLFEF